MQKLIVLLIIFMSPYSLATTDQQVFAEILTDWNHEKFDKIEALEKLFQKTKDIGVKKRAAMVLAYVPESALIQKPYVYAEFAASQPNTDTIERRHFYRMAADGYFQMAQFKKAARLYELGSLLKKDYDTDKSYLEYKRAWCFLNLSQAKLAYQILHETILKTTDQGLKLPMLTDLGRSYGEAVLSLQTSQKSLAAYAPQSKQESKAFIDGLLKAFSRFPNRSPLFYQLSLDPKWIEESLPMVLQLEWVQQQGPCEVMNIKEQLATSVKNHPHLLPTLDNCAIDLVSQKIKKPSGALKTVAQWMTQFSLDEFQKWTVQKLYTKANLQEEACKTATDNFPALVKTQPKWFDAWMTESVEQCKTSKNPFALGQTLLQSLGNSSERSKSVQRQLLEKYMDLLGPQLSTTFLLNQCQDHHDLCMLVWKSRAQKNFEYGLAFFKTDSQLTAQNDKDLLELQKVKKSIEDTQSDLTTLQIPSDLEIAPIRLDLEMLRDLQTQNQVPIDIAQDTLIKVVEDFQKKSQDVLAHTWSVEQTKNRARFEIKKRSQQLQKSLIDFSKANKQSTEAPLVAKAVQKWSQSL